MQPWGGEGGENAYGYEDSVYNTTPLLRMNKGGINIAPPPPSVSERQLRWFAIAALAISFVPTCLGIALQCYAPSQTKFDLAMRFLLAAIALDITMLTLVWPNFFQCLDRFPCSDRLIHDISNVRKTWVHLTMGRMCLSGVILTMSYERLSATGVMGGGDGGATIIGNVLTTVYPIVDMWMWGLMVGITSVARRAQ